MADHVYRTVMQDIKQNILNNKLKSEAVARLLTHCI